MWEKQKPIFLVSTGRCGSTFLSNAINSHPKLISIAELFEPIIPVPFLDTRHIISGKYFFDMITVKTMKERVKIWRNSKTRECLFLPEKDKDVSLFLCYTLPTLTENPQKLYQVVKKEIAQFSPDTPANHFIRLCELLKNAFNKEIWIERTGGSLPHIMNIIQCWPQAKIIHFYRDGRQTACSMQRHPIFRMFTMKKLGIEWDVDFIPPIEECGAMWQDWTLNAVSALNASEDIEQHAIAYEDFFTRPQEVLENLLAFIKEEKTLTDEDRVWMRNVKNGINIPRNHWDSLSDDEKESLYKSCKDGLSALGYTNEIPI
ncbi:MAG: sulfotransferase [Pseudomonadota bacterium]